MTADRLGRAHLWRTAPTTDGPLVLAIESSCDETAAAVLDGTRHVRASIVHSQVAEHAKFGGVVPELASRAHIRAIGTVVAEALREAGCARTDIAGVAVTRGPGLVGSLLVGVEFAKGFGAACGIPVVGVHHIEGHLMAPWLEVAAGFDAPAFPCVALIVSGGHTSLLYATGPGEVEIVGQTLDDAAGEAWDKVAKLLGLGYPGGPILDQLAGQGDPHRWEFPRPMKGRPGHDFSFSGIKTAVAYAVRDAGGPAAVSPADVAASFQAAACEILVHKLVRAAKARRVRHVVVSGGVACNRQLREMLAAAAGPAGLSVSTPPPNLCTDNAAMIGAAGYADVWGAIREGTAFASWSLDAVASWPVDQTAKSHRGDD